MTIWVYSYVSHPTRPSSQPSFNTEVSRTHPLLLQKEWNAEELGDRPTIAWYKRIDEHDWQSGEEHEALWGYVEEALENYGELS